MQDKARELNYMGKMGTTLVVWLGGEDEGYFAHVGDSRLYVYAAGEIRQITRDHTVAQRLIDEGTIPAGQQLLEAVEASYTANLAEPVASSA